VLFSENLHRAVEGIGVTQVLGCCYKLCGNGVEICAPVA